jgi:xylulose-5-phosphate/fructose-6-phosphate phosphoketolase
MGANPHANGGKLLCELKLPDFRDYAVSVPSPGKAKAEATRMQGQLIRDVLRANAKARNFRVFSPDETSSNRWSAVFEVTDRCSTAEVIAADDHVGPDGRVMEMLSEHQCEGWLEGYLLTGRHGIFNCYEAFIHIVDSMFNQCGVCEGTSPRTAADAYALCARARRGHAGDQELAMGLEAPSVTPSLREQSAASSAVV